MTDIGPDFPPSPAALDGAEALARVLAAPAFVDAVREAAAVLAAAGIHLLTALFRTTGAELRELAGFRPFADPLCVDLEDRDDPAGRALASSIDRFRFVFPLPDGGEMPACVVPMDGPEGVFGALLVDEGRGSVAAQEDALRRLRALQPALHARWQAHAAREALDAVERRRELYGGIVDALADPVLVTDRRNRILLENRRARALFSCATHGGAERRHRVEVNQYLFTSFLARPRPSETDARELTLVDPDTGAELLFEAVPAPLPAGAALPEDATVSLLRDVTDLRRASHQLGHQLRRGEVAEARARSERDQLNLILAHVGAPIVVTDEDGAVVLMNREAQRLFRAEAQDPGAGVAAANAERFFAALEAFAAGGEAERVGRVALRDPRSGAELPAELTSALIRDGDGATVAVVSILHDLTQEVENARLAAELARVNRGLEASIREATAELQEQNRQLAWQGQELERAYRHKSEFLASMSHELRTPINALLGYTALLRERIYGDLTDRQDEALRRMQSSSGHLLELVNDILDLARIEAGRMPLHLEPVSLAALVASVVDSVEPMARARGLRLEVDVPAELPALITDRTRVKQIVINLVSNAVKFTREGSVTVTGRALPEAETVEIEVADTGIGIDAEALPGIFEDFRQVDQSSTREFGGTGLGLSIVRKLLGLLGGSIRARSAPGEGSTFTVTLPLRTPDVPEGEESIRRAMRGQAVIVRDGREEHLPPSEPIRGG
ncbi:MAG: PAS domain-containing sensor histidine kinase [Gemmatimonadetes bacterium]|nr:PAS domain-containing sensor histidine kinase [Gemmatimonadota bacterium]